MAVSSEHGFPLWLGVTRLLRSWAVPDRPDEPRAIEGIRIGMTEQVKTGNQAGAPVGMALLADAYLAVGKLKQARGAIDAGLALSEQTGTRTWDAELHRLQGELFLRDDPPARTDAERAFRRAVETARDQEMRTFEVRSTIRLASLALGRGAVEEARTMLAPIRETFLDVETPDLAEARRLLADLSSPARV
jgi:predicted ATPase